MNHDDDNTATTLQKALDTGAALAVPTEIDAEFPNPIVHVLPEGYRVNVTDLEKHGESPLRVRERRVLHTFDAFLTYMRRWKQGEGDTEITTIWVDAKPGERARLVGYPDDHAPGQPSWTEHTAQIDLEHTPEWKTWDNNDHRTFSQEDFAEFIEDNADDLQTPSGADLLEIVTNLQASSSGEVRSAIRLDNGTVQMTYENVVTGSAATKSGTVEIPAELKLAIAPFPGGPKYELTARFRYRLANGKVSMSYKLVQPQTVIDHAIDKLVEKLGEEFGNVYRGVA